MRPLSIIKRCGSCFQGSLDLEIERQRLREPRQILSLLVGLLAACLRNYALLLLTVITLLLFFISLVGIRAYCSGILITWKKTAYLTPGAVLGLGGLVVGLVALPYTR